MQYTRKQIISYLKTHHTASIPELSQILNLTTGNIRHHIETLESENIVEALGRLPLTGRGRPTKLYGLTNEALDDNLENLSSSLLRLLIKETPETSLQERVSQVAQTMIGELEQSLNMVQRLNQVVQWLNEHHYQARWEASPDGPRIFLGQCPYAAIRQHNIEMCLIDRAILSELTGLSMDRRSHREGNTSGSTHCVFSAKQMDGKPIAGFRV
jgi:predicted ArsR family transcriptional regulator